MSAVACCHCVISGVGGCESPVAFGGALNDVKQLAVGPKRQRLQQDAITDGEHGRDGADAEGKNQCGEDGIGWCTPELSCGEAHIFAEISDRRNDVAQGTDLHFEVNVMLLCSPGSEACSLLCTTGQ